MGDLLLCALAAQQQRAKAEEAKKERTNCAPVTHMQYKSTYRPKNCKTFVGKFSACLECRVYAVFGRPKTGLRT